MNVSLSFLILPIDAHVVCFFSCSFRVYVDMREIDTKSSLGSISVLKEKPNFFRFRQNLDKILVIGVSQPEDSVDVPPLRVVKLVFTTPNL